VSAVGRDPADLIDLGRYRVADPGSDAFQALARDCREQLDERGCCILAGFLTDEAVEGAVEESRDLAPLAHHSEVPTGTAYLEIPDESWPRGHARTLTGPTALGAVAYDLFPPESVIRRLYEWDPLMVFLAAALGKSRLYRYADPLGALNLAVMTGGDELWWHFDQTDFVVSIALQDAAAGGDFEYVPMIRAPGATTTSARCCAAPTGTAWCTCPWSRARSCSSRGATPSTGSHPSRGKRRASWRCSPTTRSRGR
jgi:hypothetical protein